MIIAQDVRRLSEQPGYPANVIKSIQGEKRGNNHESERKRTEESQGHARRLQTEQRPRLHHHRRKQQLLLKLCRLLLRNLQQLLHERLPWQVRWQFVLLLAHALTGLTNSHPCDGGGRTVSVFEPCSTLCALRV